MRKKSRRQASSLSAVYWLRCTVNGRVYIGSSTDCTNRFTHHRYTLRRKIHKNKNLQADWDLHGELNFIFEILSEVAPEKLDREEEWFLFLISNKYNMSDKASGYIRSEKVLSALNAGLQRRWARARGECA